MSVFKRAAAIISAAALTAVMLIIPAGAVTVDKRSMTVKSDLIYDSVFETGREYYYKLNVRSDGELSYKAAFESYELKIHLYNEYGEEFYVKYEYGTPSDNYFGVLEDTVSLEKGTYYAMIERAWSKNGSGDVRVMFSFPDSVSAKEQTVKAEETLPELGFIIYLKKGERLSLGTMIGGWEEPDNVYYRSSDRKIAKVYSDGTVKAAAKGKATVTAVYDGREIKVTVRVIDG